MAEPERLGRLQLAIMHQLWKCGEATVTQVHHALFPTHGLAPTTIATMLKKMEVKGVVSHRAEGRRYVYRATITEAAVRKTMVAEVVERLFGGSVTAVASHLLDEYDVDRHELDELQALIDRARLERHR
jgi:predicted transcriptional regulator